MSQFNFYDIIISDGNQEHRLTYKLENHRPAQVWARLIKDCKVEDLRSSLHPWRGIAKNWDQKVSELIQLISDLNQWLPNPITHEWNQDSPQDSLNKLHIHFPDQEKNETDKLRRYQLSRYNDLIHEMEGQLKVKIRGREMMSLLLCPDTSSRELLIEEDFQYFTTKFSFGDLKLHYCHVGRHPWELFVSQDVNCPEDQILPQYEISAYHNLPFFDTSLTFEHFKKFYESSNLKWPYELENQKLAVGYINLGKLLYIDHQPWQRVDAYMKVRRCDRIVNWNVY